MSELLKPSDILTREEAITLGIPIHPDADKVHLYGANRHNFVTSEAKSAEKTSEETT